MDEKHTPELAINFCMLFDLFNSFFICFMVYFMDVYRSDDGSQVVGPGPLGAVSISHVDVAPVSSNHLRVASVFPLLVCPQSLFMRVIPNPLRECHSADILRTTQSLRTTRMCP